MKVMIVKEVMTGDVWPVTMFISIQQMIPMWLKVIVTLKRSICQARETGRSEMNESDIMNPWIDCAVPIGSH